MESRNNHRQGNCLGDMFKMPVRAGEMGQSVSRVLHKHKDLSLSPNTHVKAECDTVIQARERQRQEDPCNLLVSQPT